MSEANGHVIMKSISDALGMAPLVIQDITTPTEDTDANLPVLLSEELSKEDREAEEDFYVARENTKELLDKGKEALDGILRIASGTEQARAYEVAANLLNTVKDLNQSLLKLHEQRRQLVPVPEPEKKEEGAKQITNNNVFVGSTQEFLDMLEAREQQGKVIEHDAS